MSSLLSIADRLYKLSTRLRLILSFFMISLAFLLGWQAAGGLKKMLWVECDATVVGVMPSGEGLTKVLYKFKLPDRQLVCPDLVDNDGFAYKKGDRVKVVYDPTNPSTSGLAGEKSYSLAYLTLFSSILLLGTGLLLVLSVVRGKDVNRQVPSRIDFT